MIPQWGKGTSVAPGTSWLFRDLDFPTYTPANTGKPEVDTERIRKLQEALLENSLAMASFVRQM